MQGAILENIASPTTDFCSAVRNKNGVLALSAVRPWPGPRARSDIKIKNKISYNLE